MDLDRRHYPAFKETVHSELFVVNSNFTGWTSEHFLYFTSWSQVSYFTVRSKNLCCKKILQDKIELFIGLVLWQFLSKRLIVHPCAIVKLRCSWIELIIPQKKFAMKMSFQRWCVYKRNTPGGNFSSNLIFANLFVSLHA